MNAEQKQVMEISHKARHNLPTCVEHETYNIELNNK